MTKRYFVYFDELATHPAEPYGFDDYTQADSYANMLYGHDHKPDIRKEYANELNVSEAA